MGRNPIRAWLALPALAVALGLAGPAVADAAGTTITVNTEADNPSGVGECSGVALDCSIRQALDKSVDGDAVVIPAGHYLVGTQLNVGNDITISGSGNPVIDGGHAARVFSISSSGDVSVSGV